MQNAKPVPLLRQQPCQDRLYQWGLVAILQFAGAIGTDDLGMATDEIRQQASHFAF